MHDGDSVRTNIEDRLNMGDGKPWSGKVEKDSVDVLCRTKTFFTNIAVCQHHVISKAMSFKLDSVKTGKTELRRP